MIKTTFDYMWVQPQKRCDYFPKYLYKFCFNISIFFSDDEILSAVESGHLDILKLFLEARADKNPVIDIRSNGVFASVLHVAAQYGQLNIIKWYKEVLKFPDINPRDKSERFTPTILASETGKINVIKYYIEVEGNYILTCTVLVHILGRIQISLTLEYQINVGLNMLIISNVYSHTYPASLFVILYSLL